ncbi:MAG: hypothetical protein ACKOB1_12865 [Planctomycetia bacterium]
MAGNHLPTHRPCERTRVWDVLRGAERALATACMLALMLGIASAVRGEQITSAGYKIDISNSPVWYDSNGNLVSQGSVGSGLSVLERWNLQSQPIVSITNLSADTSLIGLQLDLSNSASKIVSCTWLEAPDKASWNWDAPSASALFQFRDPIGPGDVVTMRLGTAARPNDQGLSYMMNQTLFHPVPKGAGDCLTESSSFGAFTLFFRPANQTSIPQFDASGRPVPDSSTAESISFEWSPISGAEASSVTASESVIVPVPEPETVALAMSAISIVIGWRGLRRRAA